MCKAQIMRNPPRARRWNLWFKLCSHLSTTLKPWFKLSCLRNLAKQLNCTLSLRITDYRCLPSRLIHIHGIPNSPWCNSSNTLFNKCHGTLLNNSPHLLSLRVLKPHPCFLHSVPRSLPVLTLSQLQEVWLGNLHTLHRSSSSSMKLPIHFMATAIQYCFP